MFLVALVQFQSSVRKGLAGRDGIASNARLRTRFIEGLQPRTLTLYRRQGYGEARGGALERIRTFDPQLRKLVLYPLSYERAQTKMVPDGHLAARVGVRLEMRLRGLTNTASPNW